MSKAEAKPVYIVEGDVLHGSKLHWLIYMLLGALSAWGGIGIIVAGWPEISVWGFVFEDLPFVLSFILVTIGLLFVLFPVYKLIQRERLILGLDRLQFVTARGRVLTQIPYRNILAAKHVDVEMQMGLVVECIHIHIHDSNDPETFIAQGAIYREHHGCDCMIEPPELGLTAAQLHQRIQTHLQKFQARH